MSHDLTTCVRAFGVLLESLLATQIRGVGHFWSEDYWHSQFQFSNPTAFGLGVNKRNWHWSFLYSRPLRDSDKRERIMPSIRIKGQVYSTLEDAISTIGDNLCLQGELPGGPPHNTLRPYSHTPNVQHKSSLPLLPRGQLDVPSPLPHGRPRSASSRVYAHCINTSRNPQYSQPPPSPLSNTKSMPTSNVGDATTSQEMMTIEGALTDVRVSSHVDPGIVESSIDISTDDEGSQFSGHHHDDVVEHLDVIGIFSSLSHLKFQNNILLQTHKLVPFQISPMPQILSSCKSTDTLHKFPQQ
jgi:hypothetical protein